MNSIKGYYSIVQYCPDPSRLETVNIGVALFCPEIGFLKVLFGRRKTRVDQLFGKQDWEFVENQKAAIEARLAREHEAFQHLEDFEAYISRRANALKLTAPRSVKVENPQIELRNLLTRLVAERSEMSARAVTVSHELSDVFRHARIEGLLERNVSVHPPALPKPVKAPFAFRNGKLNLIEAVQFEGYTPSTVFNRASSHAVEGQFLSDYQDPRFGAVGLVVVAKFSASQHEERRTAQSIFEKHQIPMHDFESLGPLIAEIRSHAHL
jgi:hypothetical protein